MATHRPVIINELFGELKIPEGDAEWMVVYCKSRFEKKVADYAGKNLITYFLPQLKHTKVYQRRKVVTTSIMFPGYIFMVLSPKTKELVNVTGMAVSFIKVRNQQLLLNELNRICFAGKKDVPLEKTMWLSKGLEVEILGGALKGMRGIVETHDKISEVRLQVDILRQAVMVKIDPKFVRIIGEYEIVEE